MASLGETFDFSKLDEFGEKFRDFTNGFDDLSEAAEKAGTQIESLTTGFQKLLPSIASFQKATVLMGVGLNHMSEFMGRVSSQIGSLVNQYNPAVYRLFKITVDDTSAAIGSVLVPILNNFRVIIQGLGDMIASLSPHAKSLVAGLVAAGIGMATMTTLAYGFASAVSTATGGISAALGLVVGGATGMAFAMKGVAEVQKVVEQVMGAFSVVLNALADPMYRLAKAMEPLGPMIGDFANRLAGIIGSVAQLLGPTIEESGARFVKMFGQIGNAILKVVEAVAPLFAKSVAIAAHFSDLGKALTIFLDVMVNAITKIARLAEYILDLVALLTGAQLGTVDRNNTFQRNASVGASTRDVQFTSASAVLARAQQSAFGAGRDTPEVQELKKNGLVVNKVYELLKEMEKKFDAFYKNIGNLPRDIGKVIKENTTDKAEKTSIGWTAARAFTRAVTD